MTELRKRQRKGAVGVSRAELLWPGKYDPDGNLADPPRVSLPLRVTEVFERARARREAHATSSPRGAPGGGEGWRNKLISGDNLHVMGSLLADFAGAIDLIYIDPPFATGADFTLRVEAGDAGDESARFERVAYRDSWGGGVESYLRMMWDRLVLMRQLLSQAGSIFVQCDWRVSAFMRLMLDDVFGADRFVNEIVWYYYNKLQGNVNRFAANHDTIFWYSRGDRFTFNAQKEKRDKPVRQIKRAWDKERRRLVNVKGPDGRVLYQETDERTVDDVWRISMLQPADRTQNTGYPTQKPEALLERILSAASNPGDLVADFFCGSGTTLAVAERLGRRWIGADAGRLAVHTARKRLLEVRVAAQEGLGARGCEPFELLSFGPHERSHWHESSFAHEGRGAGAAYVAFVLDRYGAAPLKGRHLHGRKVDAVVRVGAVDAPVTAPEIASALREAKAQGARELHVLGWDWEMGVYEGLAKRARARDGLTLRLVNIPRELMDRRRSDPSDVSFSDVARLEVEARAAGEGARASRSVKVALKDFVTMIPEAARDNAHRWSDFVDYWAVDWDFRGEAFVSRWRAYRTRGDRTLALETDEHAYAAAGEYRIAVKVVDIFGNEASRLLEWRAT